MVVFGGGGVFVVGGGGVFEEVMSFEFFFAGEGAVQPGAFVGDFGRSGGPQVGDGGGGFEFAVGAVAGDGGVFGVGEGDAVVVGGTGVDRFDRGVERGGCFDRVCFGADFVAFFVQAGGGAGGGAGVAGVFVVVEVVFGGGDEFELALGDAGAFAEFGLGVEGSRGALNSGGRCGGGFGDVDAAGEELVEDPLGVRKAFCLVEDVKVAGGAEGDG